jgi:hypothetical protein
MGDRHEVLVAVPSQVWWPVLERHWRDELEELLISNGVGLKLLVVVMKLGLRSEVQLLVLDNVCPVAVKP